MSGIEIVAKVKKICEKITLFQGMYN